MNSFLRILYIFFGPGFALVFGSLLFCTLAIKLMPDDPVQEQISTSLNDYIDENPNNIVWVFNDNVFITTKPIKQGQAIERDALVRVDYGPTHVTQARIKFVSDYVTGHRAATDIPKGTPLSPKDFALFETYQKGASEQDKLVVCADKQANVLSGVIYSAAIIGGLGGIIATFIGYIWLTVEAFKKSIAWGLASIFVPFCKSVFEFKNWDHARRPLTLMVIGMFFCGSILGGAIAWGHKQKNDSPLAFSLKRGELLSRLEQKGRVVACIKDVKPGQTFQVDDLEEREIETAKIPNDAVTKASLIAGRRAKFAVAAGQLISQHDFEH